MVSMNSIWMSQDLWSKLVDMERTGPAGFDLRFTGCFLSSLWRIAELEDLVEELKNVPG